MITQVVTGTIGAVKDVDTLATRIRWVKESGRVESYDKWAKDSGLARQYLHSFLKRYDKYWAGELEGPPEMGSEVAVQLARSARVPLRWLLGGMGSPDDPEFAFVEGASRYPSRRMVLVDPANKDRWSPSAIAAVDSMRLDADEDPGERWWTEALDRIDTAIRVSIPKLPERGTDPLADIDKLRVRSAPKKK